MPQPVDPGSRCPQGGRWAGSGVLPVLLSPRLGPPPAQPAGELFQETLDEGEAMENERQSWILTLRNQAQVPGTQTHAGTQTLPPLRDAISP